MQIPPKWLWPQNFKTEPSKPAVPIEDVIKRLEALKKYKHVVSDGGYIDMERSNNGGWVSCGEIESLIKEYKKLNKTQGT